METKRLLCLVALAWCLALSTPHAQVSFNFNYLDSGSGFDDPTLGASRRAALEAAAANYGTAFSSYTATIDIDVSSYSNNSISTLMSAGTTIYSFPGFDDSEQIRRKILGGSDYSSSFRDGTLSVNFGHGWELDYNTNPSGGDFDWYGVLYHEFTHMVGFGSAIKADPLTAANATDLFNNTINGVWAKFAQFLVDANGNSVFTNTNDLLPGTFQSLVTGGSSPTNGIFFDLGSGNLVGLYSPSTFFPGSSGTHLDINHASSAYAGMMMLPSVSSGLATRTFSDVELDILRRIGYTDIQQINVVPEPNHVVLGLGGIALMFVVIRKRLQNI